MSSQIASGLAGLSLDNRQSIMTVSSSTSSNNQSQTQLGNDFVFPKMNNPPPNVPSSDEDFEITLEKCRDEVLASDDPEMQLRWATDALRQIEINTGHRIRLRELDQKRWEFDNAYWAGRPDRVDPNPPRDRYPTPTPESTLRNDATSIVTFLAEQNHPRAEFMKGMWYEFGRFGYAEDKKEAFRCYSRAADKGHARSRYRIGLLYESANDMKKALEHYYKGVEAVDAACLYRLGMMTLWGEHGQTQDYSRGVDLIRRASTVADENAAQGAYIYGMLLARELPQIQLPEGILPFDERAARIEIEKAAYMKFAKAQVRMGSAYELGNLGCEFNPSYSIHYYGLAAQQGEVEAEMGISKWFLVGYEGHFKKNEAASFHFAERAAFAGLANAEFGMGYFNELGMYVQQDIEKAMLWYRRSAAKGNTDAKGRISGLEHEQVLSPQDHKSNIIRLKTTYGNRPERFTQQRQSQSGSPRQNSLNNSNNNNNNNVPYPFDDGPPILPPLGDRPPNQSNYSYNSTNNNPSSNTASGRTYPDRRQRFHSTSSPAQNLRPSSYNTTSYNNNDNINNDPQRISLGGVGGPGRRVVSSPNASIPTLGRKPLISNNSNNDSINSGRPRPYAQTLNDPGYPPRSSSTQDSTSAQINDNNGNNAGPRKPVKQLSKPGPKTFEEMGYPATKQADECVSFSPSHKDEYRLIYWL